MAAPAPPQTMRGLQITAFTQPYTLNPSIPVPTPGPSELLLKIAVAGYCHTETMVLRGDFARGRDPLPQIPGHEPTGWIVQVGKAVDTTRWKVGMRVGCLNFRGACGKCAECTAGMAKFCPNMNMAGVTADGAMAEYMIADPKSTVPLPDNLSFEAAAPLFCAGATIYAALKTCALSAGQSVAVIGVGALGHLGVQFAKCMGLRVVAVDSRDAPLEMVKTLKHAPDAVLNASATPVAAALSLLPFPVDASVIATDALPAYEYAFALTRTHGTVVVVGQPASPIPLDYKLLVFRDLRLRGSVLSTVEECREMIKMFVENQLEVRTRSYPLEDIERLIHDTHDPHMSGKMVVKVSEGF